MDILERIAVALEKLTKEVETNTATLNALSGKTTTAAKPTTTKPAAKPAAKAADDEAKPRGRGRPPKAKTLSAKDMGEKAREFCESAGDDEEEFKERRKEVARIAAEFEVAKFSEITGDDQAEALKMMADFLEDGGEGGEGGDGEDY